MLFRSEAVKAVLEERSQEEGIPFYKKVQTEHWIREAKESYKQGFRRNFFFCHSCYLGAIPDRYSALSIISQRHGTPRKPICFLLIHFSIKQDFVRYVNCNLAHNFFSSICLCSWPFSVHKLFRQCFPSLRIHLT